MGFRFLDVGVCHAYRCVWGKLGVYPLPVRWKPRSGVDAGFWFYLLVVVYMIEQVLWANLAEFASFESEARSSIGGGKQ